MEITADRLNIAQLKKQGQNYKLHAFASVDVPEGVFQDGMILDPPALADLIGTTLAENKIKVKRAATAISGKAITRIIAVPAEMNDEELRDMVLNQEAGLYLPFPREEADVDYQKLDLFVDEDGIEKVHVLLVAIRKEMTDSYLETFQQAGLEIDVLETSSFALIRTMRDQLRNFAPQEAVAIVDIEFDNTEISIVVDGVPQFSRSVPIGTYQIMSALSRAMNLPPSRNTETLQDMTVPLDTPRGGNPGTSAMLRVLGELSDEMRRSIDFYLNQGENLEVAQLLLCGPGGGLNKLDEFLSHRLSLPANQIDPVESLSLITAEEFPAQQRVGMGVVLGLGLREV